ncbi:MAG: hypothetical protein AAB484_00315 [Patescibacteria group bacterium]
MKKFSYFAALSLAFPLSAGAAINTVWDIFGFVKRILDAALPLIIAIAVVWFIWGIFMYVVAIDDEKKKAAKDKIIYGIVGLFIMISVWGLVNILVRTFGLSNTGPGTIVSPLPTIPGATN